MIDIDIRQAVLRSTTDKFIDLWDAYADTFKRRLELLEANSEFAVLHFQRGVDAKVAEANATAYGYYAQLGNDSQKLYDFWTAGKANNENDTQTVAALNASFVRNQTALK